LGTASFPTNCGKMSELLGRADANLYLSKRSGGDTVTHGEDAATSEPTSPGFDVLDALVTAIEHKDCYTRRHSEDVTRVSLMIADQIGLDGESREVVRVAGLLHDVGKIGIPDAVLRKPGRLTRVEYEICWLPRSPILSIRTRQRPRPRCASVTRKNPIP
jgi:HD-GYP domain-containing protein (c-di-GMP phosphodiesterase class II)